MLTWMKVKKWTHLNERKEMDPAYADVTQVDVVGLIFHGHKKDHDAVDELHPLKRRDTHKQEHTVEDGHRDVLK